MTRLIDIIAQAIFKYDNQTLSAPSDYLPYAKVALAAIEEAGCAVVPKEPTQSMIYAASKGFRPRQTTETYKAMLEAAKAKPDDLEAS